MSGCQAAGRYTETLPPIAGVTTHKHRSGDHTGPLFHGQAIWVGDLVLTAGHNAVRSEGPVETLYLNGRPVAVESVQSGDPRTIAGLAAESAESEVRVQDPFELLSRWREDWALVRVNETNADAPRMVIADARAKPGETLRLVGVNPHDSDGMVRGLPLEVIKVGLYREDGTRVDPPDGVLITTSPIQKDLSGWSGGFVGRYKPREDVWEYVGTFVGNVRYPDDQRVFHVVVRPPPEVIESLLDGKE